MVHVQITEIWSSGFISPNQGFNIYFLKKWRMKPPEISERKKQPLGLHIIFPCSIRTWIRRIASGRGDMERVEGSAPDGMVHRRAPAQSIWSCLVNPEQISPIGDRFCAGGWWWGEAHICQRVRRGVRDEKVWAVVVVPPLSLTSCRV
jgi:hypothetical protein